MQLAFVCCAESGAIDQNSARVSLFNILPFISVPENRFPAKLLKLMVGFCFSKEADEQPPKTVRIDISCGGKKCSIDVPTSFGVHNIFQGLLRVDDLLIPAPGKIHIQLSEGGTVYGQFDCHVFAESPAFPVAPPPEPVTDTSSQTKPAKRIRSKSPARV